MSLSARNLKCLAGAVAAVVLLCLAGLYLYSRWELNNRRFSELKRAYEEVKSLKEKEAKPANVDVAATAKETGEKGGARLNLTFRAIGHNNVSPVANEETAFEVLNGIRSSEYFDASNTRADGEISAEVPPGTFSFKIVAKLKRPLML